MRKVNVDHIWRTLGPFGRYQWKQLCSFLISVISMVFQGLNIVFIGYLPSFHCKVSPDEISVSNVTDRQKEYRQCEIVSFTNTSEGILETTVPCENGWDYDSQADRSFVTEWDLVCQNAELGELTQVLYLVGMIVGTFVFPTLADRYGRKPVLVLSHVAFFGVSLGTAFSGNFIVFVVLRFFTGFFQQGMSAATTLLLEMLPSEIRHYCAVIGLLAWTTFCVLMSPIAYALRDYPWKYLQITYALCSACSVLQWWIADESLRWVIANGQIDRAKEIIKNACKWNKKNYREVMETIGWGDLIDTDNKALVMTDISETKPIDNILSNGENMDSLSRQNIGTDCQNRSQKNYNLKNDGADLGLLAQKTNSKHSNSEYTDEEFHENEIEVKRYSVLDICKHRRILIVSIIMWYTWLCDSFVYFGLYMTSSYLYGDRFLNFFLSALVEYPACLLQYFCLARIGRNWTAVMGHLIAAVGLGVATVLTYTAGDNTRMLAASTAFTLIGKLGITIGYNAVYLAAPELYPTNMRNIGFGACSFVEKVGTMLAPFSRNVSGQIKWLPPCVFSVMCLTTVLLFAFVPETNGVELPETIEELQDWYRRNKLKLKIGGKPRHATEKSEDGHNTKQEN